MEERLTKISKLISYVLRHKPEKIGLKLNKDGWADVKELMEKSTLKFDFNELKQVVQNDDKGRFQLSDDMCSIRACQGHSTNQVDVKFKKVVPPVKLYHGTAIQNLESIAKKGLLPGNRHYVHLSKDLD